MCNVLWKTLIPALKGCVAGTCTFLFPNYTLLLTPHKEGDVPYTNKNLLFARQFCEVFGSWSTAGQTFPGFVAANKSIPIQLLSKIVQGLVQCCADYCTLMCLLCSAVQYSAVQCSLQCSVQYNAVFSTVQCSVQCSVQYSVVFSTVQCSLQYSAVQHCLECSITGHWHINDH